MIIKQTPFFPVFGLDFDRSLESDLLTCTGFFWAGAGNQTYYVLSGIYKGSNSARATPILVSVRVYPLTAKFPQKMMFLLLTCYSWLPRPWIGLNLAEKPISYRVERIPEDWVSKCTMVCLFTFTPKLMTSQVAQSAWSFSGQARPLGS